MPYDSKFVDGDRGLHMTGSDVVTAQEILTAKRALDKDKLKQLAWAICDLKSVAELRLSPDEIRDIAALDVEMARMAPQVVVALVAPRADIYGLSRMWQVLVEDTGWVVAIFLSFDEAKTWVRTRTTPSV